MKKIFFLLFGILCSIGSAKADDVDNKQWMKGLNDLYFVSQMSLPGAHDAATGTLSSLAQGKCQDKDLAGLWDAGVRVFDLRPTDADGCPIYHGSGITGANTGINLTDALTTITGKLSSYPTEFAIILMRNENDKGSTDNWKSRITTIMSNFSSYVMPFKQNLRLGEVRKKVLILSRDYFADGYTIAGWVDKTTHDVKNANGIDFVVQDYYQVGTEQTKKDAITTLLIEARENTSRNRMFINHTSGYTGSIGTNNNIKSNANTCNTLAFNTINANSGPTGMILMDYAGSSSYNGANLCNAIIAQNRKPVDASLISTLQATKDLAVTEGVNAAAIADAESLITNPTTNLGINDGIHLLRSARKVNAWSTPDVFTGATPEANQEYYLYNIGTGMWLSHGSDWNTHAAVDMYALPVKLISNGDGKFKLQTHMFADKQEKWINWNAYVDTGDQHTWQFNPVTGKTNVFTINSEGDRTDVGRLLGYDPDGPTDKGDYQYWSTVAKDRENVNNPNNQWKLVTRAEREALMDGATASNPVDVSFLIDNGGLSRVWGLDMWTKTCDGGNGGAHITSGDDGDFNRNSDYGYEVWNANSFSFTQTLNNLRPGKYRLSVYGFFRQGNGDNQANVVNNNGALISEAYLIANSNRQALPNIATEAGKLPGIASKNSNSGAFVNWPAEALAAFESGLYDTSVDVIVGSDGTLTFGVVQDHKTTDESWVLFDGFRLAYLGTPDITIADTDTEVPSVLLNIPVNAMLTRTLTGGQWNGFSLPFSLSAAQIAASALNGAEIKQFNSVDANIITLADATEIVAGDPYLIKPKANVVNPEFDGVVVVAINEAEHVKGTGDYTFAPHLYNTSLATDGSVAYVSTTDSSIKKLTSGSIKGLRSIFQVPTANNVKPLVVRFGGDADAILSVDADGNITEGAVYNIAGQRVAAPNKGVYIVNGKKMLVK